ncbi:MAG TPA: hypothetical protein VMF87_15445 [Streptosporangiaceae bacterium]|jgi:hypothetical protein|nr:hypothetical protein [Streptosporangiaceae bacterium]
MTCPDVTAATQPPEDERDPAGDACHHPARPGPAHAGVSGLDPGAQASYRDNPPCQHQPERRDRDAAATPGTTGNRRRVLPPGRIQVAGIGTAPMSTTGYQDAVEALAVLLSGHGHSDPPAEAA